jgi:phosphoribosylaminoimidazolecarboxamide formyltransferase/IMP cyclohydrolase
VAIVTSPARYDGVLAALDEPGGAPLGLRSALAVEAFRHTAAYDARIAAELPCRMDQSGVDLPPDPGLPRSADPFPPVLVVPLEKVETLRYGENPHQPAARYRRTDRAPRAADGPFTTGAPPLQGKPLSYNNVLDASAAAAIARSLRGPACVVVKHTNPCGAAERGSLLDAWQAALAGDPEAAFGGVVALTRPVTGDVARELTGIFLEVVIAPTFDDESVAILAEKPNLRLVQDPSLDAERAPDPEAGGTVDYLGSMRTAGGAVLVGAPDDALDDPGEWVTLTSRPPTAAEAADLDLAWRLVRGVVSNAIVLVRDGQQIGLGSGQVSRVDACRQAVAKAERLQAGAGGAKGAVAASDAFFPFPDGPQVLLDAGVTAIVQPGGSVRDAEVLHAVEQAGGAMLITARRHFRH